MPHLPESMRLSDDFSGFGTNVSAKVRRVKEKLKSDCYKKNRSQLLFELIKHDPRITEADCRKPQPLLTPAKVGWGALSWEEMAAFNSEPWALEKQAFAAGLIIEFKLNGDFEEWDTTFNPKWGPYAKYRIAPGQNHVAPNGVRWFVSSTRGKG